MSTRRPLTVQWPWRTSWRARGRAGGGRRAGWGGGGGGARGGRPEPDEDVVEPGLEDREQVLARDPLHAGGLVVVDPKLLLEHAVVAASLLLLAQLDAVLRLLLAPAAVVARRVRAALDAALVREAALALEEELLALAAALLAGCARVTCHRLDPPLFARAAAVVRLRGDVLDARDLEAGGLQGADRGLATGVWPFHEHLDLL